LKNPQNIDNVAAPTTEVSFQPASRRPYWFIANLIFSVLFSFYCQQFAT